MIFGSPLHKVDPSKLDYIPSFIRTYLRYVRDTEPSPIHHIAVSLALLSQAYGGAHYVRYGSKEIYLNLYTGLIAPSGFRKTEAIRLGMEVYRYASERNPLLKEPMADITSNTALLQASDYRGDRVVTTERPDGTKLHYTSIFIVASEFASFFRRRDTDMITLLTNIFDGAVTKESFTYSTQMGGNFVVKRPYPIILMASTPEWLAKSLPKGATQGGFTNRFLYFYSKQYYPKPFPQSAPDIAKLYQEAGDFLTDLSLGQSDIAWTPEASELFSTWYTETLGGVKDEPDRLLKEWTARLAFFTIKLSGLSAFADKRIYIQPRDLDFAWLIMSQARQGTIHALNSVGANPQAWIERRVINALLDTKRTKVSILCAQFLREISPKDLRALIKDLNAFGIVKYDPLRDDVSVIEDRAEAFIRGLEFRDFGWEILERFL